MYLKNPAQATQEINMQSPGPKKKKKLDKNIVTHNGKRMTTEDANVQHYQDQVRQAYADHAEKSKKGRDPL